MVNNFIVYSYKNCEKDTIEKRESQSNYLCL